MGKPRKLFIGESCLSHEQKGPRRAADRYDECERRIRLLLHQRAAAARHEEFAENAVRIHDTFTSSVLRADCTGTDRACPGKREEHLVQVGLTRVVEAFGSTQWCKFWP